MNALRRSLSIAAVAAIAFSLSACAVPFPTGQQPAQPDAPIAAPPVETTAPVETAPPAPPVEPNANDILSTDATTNAVAQVVRARYEYVRDGDYAAACALYSEHFAANLAALAETDGTSCVEAHEVGVKNSDDYEAIAKKQNRTPLTPFFYIPSEIQVDTTLIKIEDNGTTAFLNPFAVKSLDPKEFEDGVGEVPGWIEGQDYLKLIDGHWLFIDMTEQ